MLGSETRLSLRVIWDLTLRSSGRGVRAETREKGSKYRGLIRSSPFGGRVKKVEE